LRRDGPDRLQRGVRQGQQFREGLLQFVTSCGVPPKQFIRGEWFVSIALLTGLVWILCDSAGLDTWASAAIAFAVGYTVRVLALYYAWEEPLAKEPKGVYQHDDGRPMLGRKLKGKSRREMAYLGLTVATQDSKEEQ